jgi:C4-dicarboxylate transporter DctQ subunit
VSAARRALPLRVLDHLEEWLIATLMAGATLLIFVAVVHRYTAGLAIPWLQDRLLAMNLSWAQELCIYMFVWMAKFGAAYGVRTGIHVGVDVLINRLSPVKRAKFILFGLFAGALFTAVICAFGTNFVWHIAQSDQTTPDLEWPSWIIYLAIPLGSALMCFRFLEVAYGFWKTGELPHTDHAHVEGLDPDAAVAELGALAVPDGLRPRDLNEPADIGKSGDKRR